MIKREGGGRACNFRRFLHWQNNPPILFIERAKMSVWWRCSRNLLALTHVGSMAMACNFRRFRGFILPRTRYWPTGSAIFSTREIFCPCQCASIEVTRSSSSPVLSCALVTPHTGVAFVRRAGGGRETTMQVLVALWTTCFSYIASSPLVYYNSLRWNPRRSSSSILDSETRHNIYKFTLTAITYICVHTQCEHFRGKILSFARNLEPRGSHIAIHSLYVGPKCIVGYIGL